MYACDDDDAICVCAGGVGARDAAQVSLPATVAPDSASPVATGSSEAGVAPSVVDAGSGSGNEAGAPPVMPPFTGPVDGDPNKPMVAIDGVPCGAPRGTPTPVKIGGRDVIIAYPCAHEGAAVTFLFTLHGTLQDAQKVPFTLNAGPFHRLADSHNVIYALPKAIGTQWGNMDDGKDLPHIYEVIDWVYAQFGTKFNIRSMWAQGGSWGAAYLSTKLACDPKLESRLKGVRLIVGGGCPACTSRLSCIIAQQELEINNGTMMTPEQRDMAAEMRSGITKFATTKGCKPRMGPMDVGSAKHWVWPDCQKGWVYSYYMGPGQHADAWDATAVAKTMDEMKSIE